MKQFENNLKTIEKIFNIFDKKVLTNLAKTIQTDMDKNIQTDNPVE